VDGKKPVLAAITRECLGTPSRRCHNRTDPPGGRHGASPAEIENPRGPGLAVCGTALHPVLGCEITGITLAQAVSPKLFAKVYEAFLEYQLIVFRDVDLPPATQVAFARNFGEVQVHVLSDHYGTKEHPEIYMLSNLDRDGNPSGSTRTRARCLAHRRLLARAHRASDDDVFGDRAGRRRRNRIRRHVFGLRAVARGDEAADRRPARHPQSRFLAHPAPRRGFIDGGTKSQSAADRASDRAHASRNRTQGDFLGDHAEAIEGLPYDEGRALIEEINTMITPPERVYTHHWSPRNAWCGTTAARCIAPPASTRPA